MYRHIETTFSANTLNSDVIWNIGNTRYSERVVRFLQRFQNHLCLFSSSVKQLYANYEIHVLSGQGKAIALPNPHAYYDTFSHVHADAIKPTGLFIAPTETAKDNSNNGLRLIYNSRKTKRYTSIPLAEGLQRLTQRYPSETFLPVITSKDLQFRIKNQPLMHLHRLDTNALTEISGFQREDIKRAIQSKLDSLLAV